MLALLLTMCLGCAAAGAALAEEFDVFGTVESFTWKEFDLNNTRVLKESGPLFGLGVAYRKEYPDQISLDGSAGIFGGSVGYRGFTTSGDPITTAVDYLGLKLKGDAGRTFNIAESFTIQPFLGLGIRAWARHIRDSTILSGQNAGLLSKGYTEQWTTLHARLGARGGMDISQTNSLFVEAGLKLPVYNENLAYFSREGIAPDQTMHPGLQVSLFGEAGVRLLMTGDRMGMKRMKASVFYDGLRFSRSPDVALRKFYQPRSAADIYGVNLGVLF